MIKIFDFGIMETLKQGVKYLFSVGGNAVKETLKKIGNKIVHVMSGARCNHLQILDVGTKVGFPNAKMEELVEIQETVMICENGVCEGVCNLPTEEPEPCEYVFRVSDSCNIVFEEAEEDKPKSKPKISEKGKYYVTVNQEDNEEEEENDGET